MALPALYELVGQYRRLLDIEDVPPEQLADTLAMLHGDIEEKATNIGFAIRNMEETHEALLRAITQAKGRANSYANRIDSLKEYALRQLQAAGISKVEHPMLSMSIRKNPVKVVTDFADMIPQEYMRQPETPPPVPDKVLIKEAIQAGKGVPGCHLEQGERLEVKS